MKIKTINIGKIKNDGQFLLSYPLNISKCEENLSRFPYIDFILLDNKDNLIYGFECLKVFKLRNRKDISVKYNTIDKKEALILAYNFKDKFFGFNAYEKLVFIQKALSLFTVNELYNKVNIDISINENIIKNLKRLLTDEFKDNLINDKLNIKSALKLCNWNVDDSRVLNELFSEISFSKSHQLSIIEMLEDLIFKNKTGAERIINKLNLSELYLKEKPQKEIIARIFMERYPNYQRESEKWQEEIKKLSLPQNISITHNQFFEKQNMELKINIKNIIKLKEIVKKLTD